jgi:ketosteroid isomerase-like protein
MPTTADVKPLVLDYLKAFDSRDLERCLSFCNEDATFHFLWRSFRGLKGIEKWHRDRFAADLRVTRVDDISVEGNTVNVDVIVTSNKLKARKVNQVGWTHHVAFGTGRIEGCQIRPPQTGQIGAPRNPPTHLSTAPMWAPRKLRRGRRHAVQSVDVPGIEGRPLSAGCGLRLIARRPAFHPLSAARPVFRNGARTVVDRRGHQERNRSGPDPYQAAPVQ